MENFVTSVFVYGTLRSSYGGKAHQYLSNYFFYDQDAKVNGRLYMGEYPVAIKSSNDRFIFGELYHLKRDKKFSEAIRHLDEYEEVDDQNTKKSLYVREVTDVIFQNIKIKAWIYWYNKPISSEILIPSGDIMNVIVINNKP